MSDLLSLAFPCFYDVPSDALAMRKRDRFIMASGNHKIICGHAISTANSRMWATICGHTPMNQCARPQKYNIK